MNIDGKLYTHTHADARAREAPPTRCLLNNPKYVHADNPFADSYASQRLLRTGDCMHIITRPPRHLQQRTCASQMLTVDNRNSIIQLRSAFSVYHARPAWSGFGVVFSAFYGSPATHCAREDDSEKFNKPVHRCTVPEKKTRKMMCTLWIFVKWNYSWRSSTDSEFEFGFNLPKLDLLHVADGMRTQSGRRYSQRQHGTVHIHKQVISTHDVLGALCARWFA